MKYFVWILSFSLFSGPRNWAEDPPPLIGFHHESLPAECRVEHQFDHLLDRAEMRRRMEEWSARPHHLGSAADRANADAIAALLKSWGYRTRIEEFRVLFPTPETRMVEMTRPEKFQAKLSEPALEQDKASQDQAEALPPYNAYSIDGDVTAEVVYVNYGVPNDYETLAQHGIDVRGKIALARYGGSWRGIKPKVAAEHGAVGCLIYSDPRDDGYFGGDVYPRGPWRPSFGAQRGSVADMPLYPGDPLTPFVGATENAPRLPRSEAKTITAIPVLPLSYADAAPILQNLSGPMAPEDWRGALGFTYHMGPGPATVHLKVKSHWNMVLARDVLAELPGRERPEEWILRGNHEDAWVCGAKDPLSGAVSLMEEAEAIGQLARSGWRPRRTILFAVWDGEEPGLIGSTEWVETHAAELREHGAIYINSDSNGRGLLSAGGSHSLQRFVSQIARDVPDPEMSISVGERRRQWRMVHASADERKQMRRRAEFPLAALGSGSDYTPFLQHAGVASIDLGYSGEDSGGSYHSAYDSYDHYRRFDDPNFDYEIALAQTCGRAVLRAADADLLPLEFAGCADTYSGYVDELIRLTDNLRAETEQTNRLLDQRAFQHAADPTKPFKPPPRRTPVPFLDFAPLQNAVAQLRQSARAWQESEKDWENAPPRPETEREWDQRLLSAERALTSPEGLPGRPWYRHLIYAPGFYTGYSVKTIPGVREAIEQRRWDEANRQIVRAAAALQRLAAAISGGFKTP